MKYIEIGLGNRWLIRTETEREDRTEFEQKGIVKPIILESVYLRVWIRKTCFILDSKEGFKKTRKRRNKYKFILGIVSKL
ncbi:DUF3977 family protein [Bacillus sp. DX4.1]|uniref:DUF3977 family protein n=1 Tax=Bacillus sp. DX4.1 TaxID=3055867 RepID=UPI00259FFA95|nr:DUF3977 family protein [Bacillus sp. DX4.1]MDM5188640.1 DUF3977 family protein [Bacillus sp. DX4.1]